MTSLELQKPSRRAELRRRIAASAPRRHVTPEVAADAEARRRARMRTVGSVTTIFLIHLLFVFAVTLVLLTVVLFGLWALVWRGLEFPVGLREIALVLGGGVASAILGYGVYWFGRRRF